MQGIWEAHLEGELAPGEVVDDVAVRAVRGVGGGGLLDVDVPSSDRGSHVLAGSGGGLLGSRS